MADNFYFEDENAENTPPETLKEEQKMNNVEKNSYDENMNNVDAATKNVNNNNFVNNHQNYYNVAQNQQYQPYYQPNYYSYQPSYQPFFNQYYQSPEQMKLHFEKNQVKKTANFIGIGIILFFAFNFVFSYILGAFLKTEEAINFIMDPAVTLELNVVLSVLGFGISSIFILKAQRVKASELISYGPPKKGVTFAAIIAAVGFCYTANIAVTLLQSKFQSFLPFAQPQLEYPEGIAGFALSVIAIAVVPALIEEFLFRSVIMGSLLKYGKAFAIFTSSMLFALIHGNLVQIPFAFLVGLVIGAMVVETNSIWTGVIIHFINNFISVCMDYLSRGMDEGLITVIYLFLMAFLMIIGILGFYLLSIKNKKLFSYDETDHKSTSMQRFGWFSGSASIIVFFSITFLEILAMQLSSVMNIM